MSILDDKWRETLKMVGKWGRESCPHSKIFTTVIGTPYSTKYKRECAECWEALNKLEVSNGH